MIIKDRLKYESFLIWLITPQDENEQALFKEKGLVDDYIEITKSIPFKTDEELIELINIQLNSYGKSVDTTNDDFINQK